MMSMMKWRSVSGFLITVITSATFATSSAQSQTCGEEAGYEIAPGDTLFSLAKEVYGDETKWPIIFYTNQHVIGSSPSVIRPGKRLYVPCLSKDRSRPVRKKGDDAPISADVDIRLLTGDAYPPFTDRGLDRGGMATELLETALRNSGERPTFATFWVNRWGTHLKPLLTTTAFDVGFPWMKPDCDYRAILDEADALRCDFLFSKPLHPVTITLFVRRNSDFRFEEDSDIEGRVLCRPEGYYTFDLDQNGRRWLADGKVRLLRPQTPSECFEALRAGKVDAVALATFVGQRTLDGLPFRDEIRQLQRVLSTEGLHAVVHKDHPQAEEIISTINRALDELGTAESRKIIESHMATVSSDDWGSAN